MTDPEITKPESVVWRSWIASTCGKSGSMSLMWHVPRVSDCGDHSLWT